MYKNAPRIIDIIRIGKYVKEKNRTFNKNLEVKLLKRSVFALNYVDYRCKKSII